jgi:RNase adaptor protein for sRNA GlmZ degradation
MTAPVQIVSFGFGHGDPPRADAVLDVRARYRDPHVDPSLRYRTAEDAEVRAAVMGTPGVPGLVSAVVALAHSYRRGPDRGPVVLAVGCAGGRHRAPAIAGEVAWRLERQGVPVTLTHRDMHRPVIEREAAAVAAGGAR